MINTLFKSKISRKSVQPTSEERIPKTIEIKSITHGERWGGAGGAESGMLSRTPAGPGQKEPPPPQMTEFATKTHGQQLPKMTVTSPCWASLLAAVVSLASPGEGGHRWSPM